MELPCRCIIVTEICIHVLIKMAVGFGFINLCGMIIITKIYIRKIIILITIVVCSRNCNAVVKQDDSKLKLSELLECDSTVLLHLLACVISRFHLGVNEMCALLGCYTV